MIDRGNLYLLPVFEYFTFKLSSSKIFFGNFSNKKSVDKISHFFKFSDESLEFVSMV